MSTACRHMTPRPATTRILGLLAVLVISAGVSTPGSAQDFAESLLIKAADSYKIGAFNAAARQYQEALELGADNGHVHYNYANTLFRLGRFGEAVAEYRKALLDLPRDPDIRANLALARKKAVDKIDSDQEIDAALGIRTVLWPRNQFNEYELTVVGLTAYIGFWFCIIALGLKKTSAVRWLSWIFGLTALYIGLNLYGARDGRTGDAVFAFSPSERAIRPAVVTAGEVDVYSGNAAHFQVIFKLHEGTEVDSPEIRDKWVAILLPGGQRGWVREDQIVRL